MAPQQERARRTRSAIIASAAKEFSEHGYAAASLSAILRRSGATKGAMYFHFESKEDLAKAVLETAVERILELSSQWLASQAPALEIMAGLTNAVAHKFQDDEVLRAEFRLALEPDLLARVGLVPSRLWGAAALELAERAAAEGAMREGFVAKDFAEGFVAFIIGQRYVSDLNAESRDLPERFAMALDIMLRAYAGEQWPLVRDSLASGSLELPVPEPAEPPRTAV